MPPAVPDVIGAVQEKAREERKEALRDKKPKD